MPISETGAVLARIKAETSLTWSQIADAIGASSGDYVRKVASGAKPGGNLGGVVRELMATGRVAEAAPRRRAASGAIAKVRASAASGAPSRRPSETAVRAGIDRRLFAGRGGKMGWAQSAGVPSETAGRGALAQLVTSAGRGQKRVQLRVEVRPLRGGAPRWVQVGSKGGYKPAAIARGIKEAGSEAAWIAKQLTNHGHYAEGDGLDVEVIAE